MEKKKKTLGLFLFCLFLIVVFSCATPSYDLSPRELANLKLKAVKGDGDAAERVLKYYLLLHYDVINEELWNFIGAENDNGYALDCLLYFLHPNQKDTRIRGAFWIYRYGILFNKDMDNSLKYYDYNMETAKPPNDSLYPLVSTLSEADIQKYNDGALLGSGQAALALGNHYDKDADSAEYWYRIGAQNRNANCMEIYGNILLGKKDDLDRERGKFWLRKASE